MLLQLQKYDLKFLYEKGTELYVANTLSGSYIDENFDPEVDEQVEILSLTSISPARMAELQKHTLTDPVMQKVTHLFLMAGEQSPRVHPQRYSLTFQSEMSLSWTMESS